MFGSNSYLATTTALIRVIVQYSERLGNENKFERVAMQKDNFRLELNSALINGLKMKCEPETLFSAKNMIEETSKNIIRDAFEGAATLISRKLSKAGGHPEFRGFKANCACLFLMAYYIRHYQDKLPAANTESRMLLPFVKLINEDALEIVRYYSDKQSVIPVLTGFGRILMNWIIEPEYPILGYYLRDNVGKSIVEQELISRPREKAGDIVFTRNGFGFHEPRGRPHFTHLNMG